MRKKLKTAVWILFFISLGGNLLTWGGIGVNTEFGPRVLPALTTQAPIGALYAYAGRGFLEPVGLGDIAKARAETAFGNIYTQMRANPRAMADILLQNLSFGTRLNYYGCLVLLLLGLVLDATTPKPIRTFGAR